MNILYTTIKVITLCSAIAIGSVSYGSSYKKGYDSIEITVFFKTDQSDILKSPQEYKRLLTFLESLYKKNEGSKIYFSLIGSASKAGSINYNNRLSLKRAVSVQKSIEKYSLNKPYSFLEVIGKGCENHRLESNSLNTSRFQNTRVIALFKTKAEKPQIKISASDAIKRFGKNSIGMTFVYIKPGKFIMGSSFESDERDDDEAIKKVTINKGFYIQTTEVTQKHWIKVIGKNPSSFKNCGDDCPVENITWEEARIFIRKLNKLEKTTIYSLPSEKQWEYSIKGSKKFISQIFDNPYDFAWIRFNSKGKPHSVGQKKAEQNGLFDMRGNVWEWCRDEYFFANLNKEYNYYKGKKYRVIRGGNWNSDIEDIRSSNRLFANQRRKNAGIGFRIIAQISTH